MSDERLHVVVVPRNIGDEMKVMGVPVRELVLLFGLPLFVWVLLRFSQLDIHVPFPGVGPIWLSSFVLWVLGPVLAAVFVAYKRAVPDFDMTGHILYLMFPKSYHSGRDVEYRPYLTDAVAREFGQTARAPSRRKGGTR